MQSGSFFVFVFFFIRFVKDLRSLYSLSKHLGMQTYKSNKILSKRLNNIVRGRLVYEMSNAPESQNAVAPNLVKSISI